MSMKDYFNQNVPLIRSTAKTKEELLNEIAAQAILSPNMQKVKKELVETKLTERESIGSTGFGDGIAIPHCTIPNITTFTVGAVIAENGINFKAIDGKPVYLFIYIIAPPHRRNEHIRILSDISKILRVENNIKRLAAQTTTHDFFNTMTSMANFQSSESMPKEYSQMTIHIQEPGLFDPILEILTQIDESNISIIEAQNASKFLYAMPLFSHFLNENKKGFHRVIIAVFNKLYTNDTIRKINALVEDADCSSGIMLTTQSLSYFNGNLDI